MNRRIVITGATRGIGRACAEQFASKGWAVTAVARSESDLRAMATYWKQQKWQQELRIVSADLSTETGPKSVPREAYDVVLLNAGIYSTGSLLDEEVDTFTEVFDLNVRANHLLARRLVPEMLAGNGGHLIVIGSTGTDYWKNHMTAYVASKYALRGLFLGWEAELAGSKVLATLLAPGATLTSSWANETPPPDILQPEEVAEKIWEVTTRGITGRIVIT